MAEDTKRLLEGTSRRGEGPSRGLLLMSRRKISGLLCSSRQPQVLLLLVGLSLVLLLTRHPQAPSFQPRQLLDFVYNQDSNETETRRDDAPRDIDDIYDYSRCPFRSQFSFYVYDNDHPLAKALASHPAAITDYSKACLLVAVVSGDDVSDLDYWGDSGIGHVIINTEATPLDVVGNEFIVQSNFRKGSFRHGVDLALSPDVPPFSPLQWQNRTSLLPLERERLVVLVTSGGEEKMPVAMDKAVKTVECADDCDLSDTSFCLLLPSSSFHRLLLLSLEGGCIPVVVSSSVPLPFDGLLDWRLSSLRISPSASGRIMSMVEEMRKEEVLEMRRRGRVFLERIGDAKGLATSLVAALSSRLHLPLPPFPMEETKPVFEDSFEAPDTYWPGNVTVNASETIPSPTPDLGMAVIGTYSYARWNSGRDLTWTPRTLHDAVDLPAESEWHNGTKEHLEPITAARGMAAFAKGLGLDRESEQFTVMILTYNRDESVKEIIEKLNGCPYLNKVIIVWNNLDRKPPGSWPQIHVPVEFFLPSRNNLNNRFLPFDRIETDAVVSVDDDMDLGHDEIVYAFRVWRENRDRVVGFPQRSHIWKKGAAYYGAFEACEYSMILTSFAFVHREFLFEYSYNQPPFLLDHVAEKRNCEDIAINYLVTHYTRKAPLKVPKKKGYMNKKAHSGLSSTSEHYRKRDYCMKLFNNIYGYNPLLNTQMRAQPVGHCTAF